MLEDLEGLDVDGDVSGVQVGDRIQGVLSCFDRMLFRGCLPIMSGWSMAQLLQAHEIDCTSVKPFLLANAERVKAQAVARPASTAGRSST